MTIGTLEFETHLKGRGLSPHTVKAFTSDIKQLIEFAGGRDISEDLISDWFRFMKDKGLKNKSLARKATSISAYSRLFGLGWKIPRVRAEKKLPAALSEVEARAIIQAAGTTRDPERNSLIVELMLRCGLRSAELLSIRRRDIEFDGEMAYIRVAGKGNKERRVPVVHKHLITAIRRYTRGLDQDKLLFPMSSRNLRKIVSRLGRIAGIEKRVHPHMLRHTAATIYLRRGANIETVRRVLGHESLATTQKYLALTDSDVARDISRASW